MFTSQYASHPFSQKTTFDVKRQSQLQAAEEASTADPITVFHRWFLQAEQYPSPSPIALNSFEYFLLVRFAYLLIDARVRQSSIPLIGPRSERVGSRYRTFITAFVPSHALGAWSFDPSHARATS